MTKLVELDLEFDFSDANVAIRFDENGLHESSTGQRVDFVVEYQEGYLFIEVKDIDAPNIADRASFIDKLRTNVLVNNLAGKYRDSVFFRKNCKDHKSELSIDYIVVIAMSELEPALALSRQDLLHRSIPVQNEAWTSESVRDCVILNLEQYKRKFGEHSVRRISEGDT